MAKFSAYGGNGSISSAARARLPDTKTGTKTVRLTSPALTVLAELPRVEDSPHLIVGGVKGAALVNFEKPWRAIRKAAGLEDVRLHDLQHPFASVAAASGMGLPIIGKMLGHSQAQTTQRYAHLASEGRRSCCPGRLRSACCLVNKDAGNDDNAGSGFPILLSGNAQRASGLPFRRWPTTPAPGQ